MRLNHRQPSFQDKATPCQGPKSIQWGNNRAFRGEECENLVQATGRHRIDVRADATLLAAPGNGNSSQAGLCRLVVGLTVHRGFESLPLRCTAPFGRKSLP
jgi:hypothetical protein